MKEALHYFFGAGEQIEFRNFGIAHLIPVALLITVILLIRKYRRQLLHSPREEKFRLYLALLLIFTEMSYYWRLVAIPELNPNPIDHLPITVCGWCVIFSSYMLLIKNQKMFDVCYFWLLSGTVFALITPTVISYTGPTRFRYYQFWLEHTLGYVAVFYMIFVHGMRPTFKSLVRSVAWLVALALVAYWTNRLLGPGANYLFLAAPESTPSVLDILPPNFVLRTSIMAAVVLTLHGVAYLPWYLMDRKKQKTGVPAA